MMKRSLLFLALGAMVLFGTSTSQAATLVVDDDLTCPGATFTTIQGAVTVAAPGDTIRVCPGTYPENVVVPKTLRLLGAQAGNPYVGRTFPSTGESTVVGSFTITAARVTLDGFSVTSPLQSFGILVKTPGNDALLTNNIIYEIGNANFTPNTTAIYLEHGPDSVRVVDNWISTVQSVPSAQGILIGDSTASNPSLNILVTGNRIEKITSTRGAYGIQVNNGASTASTATGFTTVQIRCNTIDSLTGGVVPPSGWAHAIGLEGPTPNVVVEGNSISNLVDLTPDPNFGQDAVAVYFEANPFFPTAEVHFNNFNVTIAAYGIAVAPSLSTTAGNVDGTRNWWGHSSGPGPVGPGIGARVSPKVRYAPWLRSPAPCGICGDDNRDDKDNKDDKDDKDKGHGGDHDDEDDG